MRQLSTRVFSFVLALILCIGVVSVGADTASAAEVPKITVTPLVTDSVNKQAFQVSTSVDNTYCSATYGGETRKETLSAGTHVLNFDTSSEVRLEVYAVYVDDNNNQKRITVRSTSSNAYEVYAYCVSEENNVELLKKKIKLSKYNEPEVVYNAPTVIDGGNVEYHAANPSVVFKYGDGSKTIYYKTEAKGSKSVKINYVDDQDAVLYTETRFLNYGETTVISAPATYTKDGSTYTLKTNGSHNVTYENAKSVYTFEYAKQVPAAQLPYDITIKLVDEDGKLLNTMKKSVDVGKQVTVTLPTTYEVGLKKYELAEGQAASIVREYASTESKTYTVKYKLVGETAAYQVTINLVDKATGKVLDTVTATVEPDGAPYTYDIGTKNYIEKDGVTYQVLAGQGNSKGKIVHAYGDATKTYNLYYTAKLEKNPESYEVSMRYICVNNNAVLATETQIVNVNSSVTFKAAPATLNVAGKEYILLNGQGGTTVHKYNDPQTSYEIYYRDSSIKVENNDIIYVPGDGDDQDDEDQDEPSQPTTPDNSGSDTTIEPDDEDQDEPSQPTTPDNSGSDTTVEPDDEDQDEPSQPTTPDNSGSDTTVEPDDEDQDEPSQPTTPDNSGSNTTVVPDDEDQDEPSQPTTPDNAGSNTTVVPDDEDQDEPSQPTTPDNAGSNTTVEPDDEDQDEPSQPTTPDNAGSNTTVVPDDEDQDEPSQPTTPDNAGSNTTVEPEDDTRPTTPGTTVTPGAQTEPEEDAATAAGTVVDGNDETSNPTGAETEEPEEESSASNEEVAIIEEDEVPLANQPVDEASEGTTSAMPFVIGGIGLLAIIILVILFIVKKRRTA